MLMIFNYKNIIKVKFKTNKNPTKTNKLTLCCFVKIVKKK